MENILNTNFSYSPDLLFNSYYDSSYSGSDLFNVYQHESPDPPIFEFYGSAYDSSDLFLDDTFNETQIGIGRIDSIPENEDIYRYDFPENENINRYDVSDDEDINHQEWEYNNSECEEVENRLKLNQEMEFKT